MSKKKIRAKKLEKRRKEKDLRNRLMQKGQKKKNNNRKVNLTFEERVKEEFEKYGDSLELFNDGKKNRNYFTYFSSDGYSSHTAEYKIEGNNLIIGSGNNVDIIKLNRYGFLEGSIKNYFSKLNNSLKRDSFYEPEDDMMKNTESDDYRILKVA